ncbi:MAG: response regulator transcription factor [Chloroflexi bacterium]|nr:response regulator transcription factor [Chloroflexota bacterium]
MSQSEPSHRILIVDDEPRLIRLMRLNLEHAGYEVFEAQNGQQALEQNLDVLPDLILLDVMMPELDGFETLKLLREMPLRIDDRLTIDFDRREVRVEGKLVKLRPTEFRLLYHLVQNAGWVVAHDQLLARVWGYEYRDETHYLRLYINYLRQKLEKDSANPEYILTERGVGYRFVDFRKDSPQ